MDEATIERITAYAALSDPAEDLAEAARWATEGDVDWQAWLADWRLGLALILRLDVVVAIARPGAEDQRLTCSGRSVWVEKHVDPPTVQEQLRQVAGSHVGTLAADLRREGVDMLESDLDGMYVEVRLDRSLREALRTPPTIQRGGLAESRVPEAGR